MENKILLYKNDKLNMSCTYRLRDVGKFIVDDNHGEYDRHADKLRLNDVYTNYDSDSTVEIVGTSTVDRRNVSNSTKEVYIAKITKSNEIHVVTKDITEVAKEALRGLKEVCKYPLFWIGVYLVVYGIYNIVSYYR